MSQTSQNKLPYGMDETVIADATARQRRAADPFSNVWVDASAGSGKTKVLTDRVLCLLLSGAKPEEILCLTYTKAAANEMAGRVRQTLSKWAISDDKALLQMLASLPIKINAETLLKAQKLFYEMLDNPTGLQAQTIHGFCERVLRQFPLEADLPLGFQVIEGSREKELFNQAFEAIAQNEETKDLLITLSQYASDNKLGELIEELIRQRRKLRGCFERYKSQEQLEHCLRKTLKLPELEWTAERLAKETIPTETLQGIYQAYFDGTKVSDKARADKLWQWLQQQDYNAYESVFLTQAGERAKSLYCKDTPLTDQQKDILEQEAERVHQAHSECQAQSVFERSATLLNVSLKACQIYEDLKRQQNVVDYEDLIERSVQLLTSETAVWVRYKLDQRIKHILMDEAQDSSNYHWKLVDALIEEYDRPDEHRSFFVVGDYKQSIYSFQGAAPDLFRQQCEQYRTQYQAINNWQEVGMNISFRSSPTILSFVDKVYNEADARQGVAFGELQHAAAWQAKGGIVERWPLIEKQKVAPPAWTLPGNREQLEDEEYKLCQQIVDNISNWLENNITVDNQPDSPAITAGDILILLRRRGTLSSKLRQSLVEAGIPVMDSDRLKLTDELLIQDLLALASVMLCTPDDYSLACILKSPIFGYSEEQLFQLCHGREGSLWQQMMQTEQREVLRRWRVSALYKTPSAFFTEVLFKDKIQQQFIDRMGESSVDLIRLFMEKVLEFEQQETPTLQGFILWMQQQDEPFKNELVQGDKARIMTVHGSKGLESPVVILADADLAPDTPKILYFCAKRELYLYGKKANEAISAVADTMHEQAYEEYHRLLYVAMTRAENRLCVTGIASSKKSGKSWYDYIAEIMGDHETYHGDNPIVPTLQSKPAIVTKKLTDNVVKPAWLYQDAPPEPVITIKSVTASQEDTTQSVDNRMAAKGTEIHRLLQRLPQLPKDQWASYVPDESMLHMLTNVLEDSRIQWIFSKNSQAEVPVSGYYNAKMFSGRIDRLVVEDDTVHIIDYKTGHPSPNSSNQQHVKQLAAYKSLLQKVYPNHHVKAWVLWTQNIEMVAV